PKPPEARWPQVRLRFLAWTLLPARLVVFRWYDAPKASGDFHAWNDDGLSPDARAHPRAGGKTLWTSRDRFAPSRSNHRAYQLWRGLSTCAPPGACAGACRPGARRPRGDTHVEPLHTPRSLFWHSSGRWRAPHAESTPASRGTRLHRESCARPLP